MVAEETKRPYEVLVSASFLVCSGVICIVVAFGLGLGSHYLVVNKMVLNGVVILNPNQQVDLIGLPKMYFAEHKSAPKTIYTSKTFTDESIHASSSTVLAEKRMTAETSDDVCRMLFPDESKCSSMEILQNESNDEVHEPAGQHLLVDMQHLDESFLNSETRIAQAMVEIVSVSGLTMLSYHCHELQPTGVTCVGVLLESHISVHTWPLEGVLLLDLFTCGPSPLLPLLPLIESTFGIRRADISKDVPYMNWAHKKRGFRNDNGNGVQGFDIDKSAIGWLEFDLKNIVISVETQYQQIDIIDLINPRFMSWEQYNKSISDDGSYEALHPEFFRPDRFLFLNGVIQSRTYGEVAYHEALVHPAMLIHPNPKRVAIIGGGEGATLREVLKYRTVEQVVMIEIDEMMVNIAKQYLPELHDCSNFEGSAESCFDDKRTTLICTDAGSWFIDRFSNTFKDEDKFDVVIMDSLDPLDMVEFSNILLGSDRFVEALDNSLTEEGVFVAQMGEEIQHDPNNIFFEDHSFIAKLLQKDFSSVKLYNEMHGGFFGVWQFMVAMKSFDSRVAWYSNQAEADYALRKRIVASVDGADWPLRYFDGATLMTYQYASRVAETMFCTAGPAHPLCSRQHGYDPDTNNIAVSALEVKESNIKGAGRGVFFKEDFSAGTYTSIDEGSHNIMFMPFSTRIIQLLSKLDYTNQWKTFDFYMFGYGFAHDFYGDVGYSVDASIMTFINHGCNGTYNMGSNTSVTEITADLDEMPPELSKNVIESSVLNVFVDRNHFIYLNGLDTLLRDVKAGEELKDNYLGYLHNENWRSGVSDYRAQCLSQGKGAITVYETEEK